MKLKPLIVSIKGIKLTKKEKILLKKEKPWGIILFKRNLKTFTQIKDLIIQIKAFSKNKNFPIIIDEEGSSVSRLKGVINHNISSNFLGNLYKKDKFFSLKILKLYIFSLSSILKDLGFNINTVPVLDILKPYTNKIIGKRSFSKEKKIVKEMGNYTIKYLHANNLAGIIKHIPGHGSARTDSHKKMPIVSLSLKNLNDTDFYPFKLSKAKFAMTAHILYKNIDKNNVATFSKTIIEKIIRKKIGFKGILISDDISMKALKYDLVTNAKKSIQAGCNIVLYCAGNINDNYKLIKSLPYIDKFTSKKTSEFYKFLR
jgi:beta-N-acetylhexosaminidase